LLPRPTRSTLFPYTTLFRSLWQQDVLGQESDGESAIARQLGFWRGCLEGLPDAIALPSDRARPAVASHRGGVVGLRLSAQLHVRSEEHTSELQSLAYLVCRL